MQHAHAIANKSVERYLLKELSDNEVEEFERHYFECEECAMALESGDIFVANARDVLAAMPEVAKQPSFWERFRVRWTWSGMLLPATSLALCFLAVYQGAIVIPRLSQPRILPAFQLVGASRGEEAAKIVPAGAPAFALTGDIPPDAHFAKYVCVLQTGGQTVFSLGAAPPATGQPITILVPAKDLKSGAYQLTIFGAGADKPGAEKVFTSSFEVHFQ